jgi:type II restriction/modification system DNA methylase subunit YeeA
MFPIKSGMSTTNNARFLRQWHEVDFSSITFSATSTEDAKRSTSKWFPYKKGGEFRKWAGNDDYVLNWKNDGEEIKLAVVSNPTDPNTTHWSRRIFGTEFFFRRSITWTKVSSSAFSVRYSGSGSIFSDASNGAFPEKNPYLYAGYLNSNFANYCLSLISPPSGEEFLLNLPT